jgi:hypothetical protein
VSGRRPRSCPSVGPHAAGAVEGTGTSYRARAAFSCSANGAAARIAEDGDWGNQQACDEGRFEFKALEYAPNEGCTTMRDRSTPPLRKRRSGTFRARAPCDDVELRHALC